ncbi:MAG: response regulator [Deltaproteobacteria bacterium]|nr:response regulator [Deltaproteobacteria bacterium]
MIDKPPLILIVEDNPKNIQFLGNLLLSQNYEIGVAQNGINALTFLEERVPDLILLDVMMPEMDGYEFCRKIKNNLALSHIPVIFLTAKSESDDIVKGFEVGGTDYVTKPFIAAELLARIKTQLEIKQLRNLIPICSYCKKVRDDEGLWSRLEHYINTHTNTRFSHSLCKQCAEKYYPEMNLSED